MNKLYSTLISCLFLASCTKGSEPSSSDPSISSEYVDDGLTRSASEMIDTRRINLTCSNPDVKTLVLQIYVEEITSQLFQQNLYIRAPYAAPVLARFSIKTWKTNPPNPKDIAVNWTFNVADILTIIADTEKQVADMQVKLVSIRVEQTPQDSNKIFCAGTMEYSNGDSVNVKYTSQYTEDGDVFAEVEMPD